MVSDCVLVGCVYTVSLNLGLAGTVDPLSVEIVAVEIVALVTLRLDADKPPFYIYTLAFAYPTLVVEVDFTPVKKTLSFDAVIDCFVSSGNLTLCAILLRLITIKSVPETDILDTALASFIVYIVPFHGSILEISAIILKIIFLYLF